jgi:hypothetical protein
MNPDKVVYLVGDVRFSSKRPITKSTVVSQREFLLYLQILMETYGIVKVDLAIDPTLYNPPPDPDQN